MVSRLRKWLDRDPVCSLLFIPPAVVVMAFRSEGRELTPGFWVAVGLVIICLVGATHWWISIGVIAFLMLGPLVGSAFVTWQREAVLGTPICVLVLVAVWRLQPSGQALSVQRSATDPPTP